MLGIAATAGRSAATQPDPPVGDPAWAVAEVVLLPAQFALLAIALMAVTSDHATGGIVPTLQATPRRGVLFLARTLVAAGTATGLGVLLATGASLLGWAAARPVLTLPADRGVDVLTTVAFVLAAGTLLAVGLGFLLRSTAGVLVSVFLLMLVLPGLLPQLGYEWSTQLADVLPGTGAIFLLTEEPRGRGLTDTSAGATMLLWAAAARPSAGRGSSATTPPADPRVARAAPGHAVTAAPRPGRRTPRAGRCQTAVRPPGAGRSAPRLRPCAARGRAASCP